MKGSVLYDAKPILKGSLDVEAGAVIEEKNITANGTYNPPSGVDGFAPVNVNVPIPEPVIESKNITANGTYTAPEGVDGYSPINVNVPVPTPVIESTNIIANGTYNPPSGVDGFAPVTVNVPEPVLTSLLAEDNGTYTPGSGADGFSEVVVNVQSHDPVVTVNGKNMVLINTSGQSQGWQTFDVPLIDGKKYILLINDQNQSASGRPVLYQYWIIRNSVQYPTLTLYVTASKSFELQLQNTQIRCISSNTAGLYATMILLPDELTANPF